MTRAGMLSRVMISCGGTVSVTVRRLTRTIRSIDGISRTSPGPRWSISRPSRNTTPRSYSRRTRTDAPAAASADDREHDDDDDDRGDHGASSQSSAARTRSVSPLSRSTTTGSPSCSSPGSRRRSQRRRARHRAPSTSTLPPRLAPAVHDADVTDSPSGPALMRRRVPPCPCAARRPAPRRRPATSTSAATIRQRHAAAQPADGQHRAGAERDHARPAEHAQSTACEPRPR